MSSGTVNPGADQQDEKGRLQGERCNFRNCDIDAWINVTNGVNAFTRTLHSCSAEKLPFRLKSRGVEKELPALLICCPHCGHVHTDEFEVLSLADSGPMKCESCNRQFSLVIWECPDCEEPNGSTSVLGASGLYKCSSCGADCPEGPRDGSAEDLYALDTWH